MFSRGGGILAVAASFFLLSAASAFGATATQTVAVAATVAARAALTVGSATLTFADANPDTTPSLAPNEGAITIAASGRTSATGNITLTVVSSNDLVSGADLIAAANLTWTASGAGFVGGAMNKTTGQSVGSWTGPGSRTGTQTYSLVNSWSYATGNYSMTVTYTLTAP